MNAKKPEGMGKDHIEQDAENITADSVEKSQEQIGAKVYDIISAAPKA